MNLENVNTIGIPRAMLYYRWQALWTSFFEELGISVMLSPPATPEVDIMPVPANLSQDYKIPVLYLTYDSQRSDVGLVTGLEDFYDMLEISCELGAVRV